MSPRPKHLTHLLAASATVLGLAASPLLLAQTQPQIPLPAPPPSAQPASPMNHTLIVIDPAHGGPNTGARLGDQLLEKDVTLALAARLRSTLASAGFNVVSTREADALTVLTTDQRAEIANRTHALACLILHATASGSGVHLYASTLAPKDPPETPDEMDAYRPAFTPTAWDTAQAESVRQSLQLAGDLRTTLSSAGLPVAAARAPVRPLDNLMCPAVAVEFAPFRNSGGDTTPVSDAGYQQRLAEALARALQLWRTHADPAATTPIPSTPAKAAP